MRYFADGASFRRPIAEQVLEQYRPSSDGGRVYEVPQVSQSLEATG